MSNPYDASQQPQQPPEWDQPQYNQPQYNQPQYNQPQQPQQPEYNQPQWDQPQYNQPQQPEQPQWGQQQYGQPNYGEQQYGAQQNYGDQGQYGQAQNVQYDQYGQPVYPIGGPPAKNKTRTRGIIAAATAVVVIGGGAASYVAFSSSSSAGGGASTPTAAVQTLVSSVNSSDVIGVLDDLAPGERDAIAKPFQDQFNELKKNGVISSSASASHLAGVTLDASDLKFGKAKTINDHVQVVPLTGGTIHVSADAMKLPLTKEFLNLVANGTMSGPTKVDKTINIAKVEKQTGKPVEIATQQVDGKWYPSLFYTIADYATMAAHLKAPTSPLPAVGQSSANDAVHSMLDDLLAGKVQDAIELTSPDELQVLHDYGSLIVSKAHYGTAPFQIERIQFTDSSINGGTRVSLKSLTASAGGSQPVGIKIANDCVNVTVQGHSQNYCAKNAIAQVEESGKTLTSAQKTAITHLFSAVESIGIDTTESNGQWFVNPVRSYFDLSGEVLSKLQKGDLTALISLRNN